MFRRNSVDAQYEGVDSIQMERLVIQQWCRTLFITSKADVGHIDGVKGSRFGTWTLCVLFITGLGVMEGEFRALTLTLTFVGLLVR